ncbi:MAG TPA: homoserine dehydrogenase [Gammaproteobacteria bacterium]|nr:homoserine dehydrogenase [Gammaproteobacteria bacterium]
MKSLRVGLCGVGNVGRAVLKTLISSSKLIEVQGGVHFDIELVGARRGKKAVPFNGINVTKDLKEVATNPNVDVLVEVIGGVDFAHELVITAIKEGKHIVTANKALIANHGNELFKLAKENKVEIGFEASVAGGTPVIKALREGLVANRVKWFAGILNGTSNYVLTEMESNQSSFEVALGQAQALGLAESDPTMDINGTDAAQKASILAALAFHVPFDFSLVSFEGIEEVELEDLKYARELGYSIKHIARGELENNIACVSAYPTLVNNESLLSQVDKEMNALEIFSEGVGSTVYYGPGAGPEPTASAVIADLVDIAKGGWELDINSDSSNKLQVSGAQKAARYYRLQVKDEPGVIAKISSVFGEKDISIDALIQHEARSKEDIDSVPVVIISGEITDNEAVKLKNILEDLPEVFPGVKKFRIHSS